jgi:octaprenyl-diphosphate synthase
MAAVASVHRPVLAVSAPAESLARLSTLLAADMQAVNATIMRQMASDVPLIPQIAQYLIAAGGKRIRPLMTLAAARLGGYGGAGHIGLATAVEFIHTATLLHDDVVDESALRRGNPSANAAFGNQASVLVGDFLFSRAFQLMVECGDIAVLGCLARASCVIAEGEVMQLQATGDLDLGMAGYERVIGAKTAALFMAAMEAGAKLAKMPAAAVTALAQYGYHLGMAFQIADDVLDYTAHQDTLGKALGDDFKEGKITLPVLIALAKASQTERAQWQQWLVARVQDDDSFAQAQRLLDRHDALALSRDAALGHVKAGQEALRTAAGAAAASGDRAALFEILGDLILFAATRDR